MTGRAQPKDKARLVAVLACAGGLLLAGCEESDAGTEAVDDGGSHEALSLPSDLVLTADWLQQSISFVDLQTLRSDTTERDAVVVHALPLPEFAPGPLEIEITPDGSTALVSVSAGFFRVPGAGGLVGASDIADDEGTLLFVDVDSAQVLGSLETGADPMGIAITPDGEKAFVAHFTSGNVAVVDVASQTIVEDFEVGQFAEEITFDEAGTVGIVGYSSDGSVRTFGVDDPAGTLSERVALEGDSAGVAFFPGTRLAFVVQAPNPLSLDSGYTLVDVASPSEPAVLEDVRFGAIVTGYPAVAAPARDSVLVPVTLDDRLVVREYVLEDRQVSLKQTIDVTDANLLSALGVNYDGDHTVVMALTADRAVAVADLDRGTAKVVPWPQDRAGPADLVVRTAP